MTKIKILTLAGGLLFSFNLFADSNIGVGGSCDRRNVRFELTVKCSFSDKDAQYEKFAMKYNLRFDCVNKDEEQRLKNGGFFRDWQRFENSNSATGQMSINGGEFKTAYADNTGAGHIIFCMKEDECHQNSGFEKPAFLMTDIKYGYGLLSKQLNSEKVVTQDCTASIEEKI